MRRRTFVLFFILEILSILFAMYLFRTMSDPRVAGVVAGAGFFTAGMVIIVWTWRWVEKWTLPTFWLAHIHIWLVTLPILLVRLANWEEPFPSLTFFGMSGTTFHRTSELVFTLLIVATVVDWLRCFLRKKTKGSSSQEIA